VRVRSKGGASAPRGKEPPGAHYLALAASLNRAPRRNSFRARRAEPYVNATCFRVLGKIRLYAILFQTFSEFLSFRSLFGRIFGVWASLGTCVVCVRFVRGSWVTVPCWASPWVRGPAVVLSMPTAGALAARWESAARTLEPRESGRAARGVWLRAVAQPRVAPVR
jgi:hypothetical protein